MKFWLARWWWQLFLAIDRLANVVLCDGLSHETMSSNCWRMEQEGKFWGRMRPIIDWWFAPFVDDHCHKSYLAERRRWAAERAK